MSLISRAFSRMFLHTAKLALRPIEAVNARLYMRFYVVLLRRYGMNFTGEPRYIASTAYFDDMNLISIGERVVISKNVTLLTHDYSITTALIALGETPATDVATHRGIVIGSNVFIGMNVTLLPGTTIGENVIVGAGSVVRGTIPSGAILLGNPATVVGQITDHPERWRERSSGPSSTRDKR